jgi:glycosyltransferase involved in cell wall biosynthesis
MSLHSKLGFVGRQLRDGGRRLLSSELPPITLLGNPYEAIGRSEHIRTIWRALNVAGVPASIYDVYDRAPDAEAFAEMGHRQVDKITGGIRIFHLNGEEIEPVLPTIERRHEGFFSQGYNIVAPAWELPRYPAQWARELDRFDEVWAPTAFVAEAIRPAVSIPVVRMRNACEPHISKALDRSSFGIPDDAFAILFLFDLRSFSTRKNPFAAIEAFRQLAAARPAAKAHLILKLNYSYIDPRTPIKIKEQIAALQDSITVIDATITNNGAKNLIRCCDCFLSLHRSEGFGRGPAEAMFFAKPVVATGWSGNMEYMNDEVSFPVDYSLQPVIEGEYPHYQDQVWADPDVTQATEFLIRIVDDPEHARAIGQKARAHMQRHFSDAILGASYRRRLETIAGTRFFGFSRYFTPHRTRRWTSRSHG